MRKFLVPVLLASALLPATAYAEDSGIVRAMREHGERASQPDKSTDNRPQRAERTQRERSSNDGPKSIEPIQNVKSGGDASPVHAESTQHSERRSKTGGTGQQTQAVTQVEPVGRTQRSGNNLANGFGTVARQKQAPGNVEVHRGDRNGSDDHRWSGSRDGSNHRRWSSDWRRDHRYDWRSYRSRYGSLYRLGRYYDPYGWGYRRFSIGYNLWPSYYGSSSWLNDPWQYRLPPAYGPYRWVRYYDDALLVNIYSGQVVDVIHNFFW